MKRLKILFYSHIINYAGTWRSHERIIEGLDRDLFEPYVFYWEQCREHNRLEAVAGLIGRQHLIPFYRSAEKTGAERGWRPIQTDFSRIVMQHQFDIIHFARSGYFEWPFVERLAPVQIETNIFGYKDTSLFLDRSIAICHYIARARGDTDVVIYNPIPEANMNGANLRKELAIPNGAVVMGRIGRPANFTPIALEAFSHLVRRHKDLFYIIIGPCEKTRAFIEERKIPNVRLIAPTMNDAFIDAFHRTIDVMLHYRSDGEVHSTAIAQAMMFGIPVISHVSNQYNGQIETIGNGGGVARDLNEYIQMTEQLIKNPGLRSQLSETARKTALEKYEQKKVVQMIQDRYIQWYRDISG
ncbi:MAG: glycosyltransferase [Deltaproteobacteria bacterium]|nr:glycosyltransferase [Deltaproteobacteria bacterium]